MINFQLNFHVIWSHINIEMLKGGGGDVFTMEDLLVLCSLNITVGGNYLYISLYILYE